MDYIQNKLDELLSIRKDIVIEIADSIDDIKAKTCPQKTGYATKFDWLGVFCPSLVIDKITGGYKKGRILKKQPKSKSYVQCYYDINGQILYFENYNEFGCEHSCYFKKIGNALCAAPYTGQGRNEYPAYVHYMIFDDSNRIKEYSYMTSGSINHEEYDYLDDGKAICYNYYYVPGKKENQLQESKISLYLQDGKVKELVIMK